MNKSVIFDFDGTLVDSMPYWEKANHSLLEKFKITPPLDINQTLLPLTNMEASVYIRDTFSVPLDPVTICRMLEDSIYEAYAKHIRLKEGACDVLEYLHRNNIPMTICTANDLSLITAAVKNNHLEKYFCKILDCPSYNTTKHQPDIFFEACKIMGSSVCDTIVFEDAYYSLKTAKQNGFLTVGIKDAGEHQQAQIQDIVDLYITDYKRDFSKIVTFVS